MIERFFGTWAAVVVCCGLVGCTTSVRPMVSESEFVTDRPNVNANVILVSTDAFRGSMAPILG